VHTQHGSAAKAMLSTTSGRRSAPEVEETMLTGLGSALSERCRQAVKLMGPFLVMSEEEVTFVRTERVT